MKQVKSAVLTIGRITTQQTKVTSVKRGNSGTSKISEGKTGMKRRKLDLDQWINMEEHRRTRSQGPPSLSEDNELIPYQTQ